MLPGRPRISFAWYLQNDRCQVWELSAGVSKMKRFCQLVSSRNQTSYFQSCPLFFADKKVWPNRSKRQTGNPLWIIDFPSTQNSYSKKRCHSCPKPMGEDWPQNLGKKDCARIPRGEERRYGARGAGERLRNVVRAAAVSSLSAAGETRSRDGSPVPVVRACKLGPANACRARRRPGAIL